MMFGLGLLAMAIGVMLILYLPAPDGAVPGCLFVVGGIALLLADALVFMFVG